MSRPIGPATIDRVGRVVAAGTIVRVLRVHEGDLVELEPLERERVLSMVGVELPVYEVDQWGRAWVEKWWSEGQDHSTSHSLALESVDMEVVGHGSV